MQPLRAKVCQELCLCRFQQICHLEIVRLITHDRDRTKGELLHLFWCEFKGQVVHCSGDIWTSQTCCVLGIDCPADFCAIGQLNEDAVFKAGQFREPLPYLFFGREFEEQRCT